MENSGFHSTYNDYLIFKTKQQNSLRNQILDPNLHIRHNLPLFINYQISQLRKEESKQNIDYNSIHNKITQKIEKINELSIINEKTPNNKFYDNFLPSASRKKVINVELKPDNTVKNLYNKIYKKNEDDIEYIDRHFTFQTPGVPPHKKIEKKEKLTIDKNLKLLMHESINEKLLINLFKKFSCLQLKKNIMEEKKEKKLNEDPNALDFESRYDSLYKKLNVNKTEYQKSLKELCRTNKINMSKILDVPEATITHDFMKRYSIILRNKDLAKLHELQKKEATKGDDKTAGIRKKRGKKAKIFQSDYFTKLLNEPEFSFDPDAQISGPTKRKTISLDLQSLLPKEPIINNLKLNKGSISHTKRSNVRSNSNDYSIKCKKHTYNIEALCTTRLSEPETMEKIKNFYSDCQDEVHRINQLKDVFEKKINKTQKKAGIAYNRLKTKEKTKNAGISNNFQEFINQREFKRKLINNLISESTEAEKNYIMISYKQKNV